MLWYDSFGGLRLSVRGFVLRVWMGVRPLIFDTCLWSYTGFMSRTLLPFLFEGPPIKTE